MGRINKIVLVNASGAFEASFTKKCSDINVPCHNIDSRECIIVLDQNKDTRLICNNEEVLLENSYFFIRIKRKNSEFATLLCEMLDIKKVPFSDPVNTRYSDIGGKIVQALWFVHHDVPHPFSIICTEFAYSANKTAIFERINFPCVIKDKSQRGLGVWKVCNEQELEKVISKIEGVFIIQEFIPNDYDLRILVWNKTVFGAIKRSSADGFLNNISKGGTAEPIDLSDAEKELSILACKVSKLDFGGVDIIRTETGPIVLEVNKSPQIKGFTQATGIDIPAQIVEQINKEYLSDN